jgi:2-methylcitrate dehydratase PrpD
MQDITRTVARFTAGLEYRRLPPEVAERARALVLDHVGIALRARHAAEIRDPLSAALGALGLVGGSARVVGDAARYHPPGAAFFNGALSHSLDFDDTHAAASIHPSAPIVPAAFAAAQMSGAGGEDVLAGIVAGFELQIRLSLALDPSLHYARGYHPTATCGVFGAAAAAARVFGLGEDEVVSALGLCGSQSAGSMQFLADGAWNKPFHVGWAAMGGLVAATLAREGFRGTELAFEGEAGFLVAYSPRPDPAKVVAGLGERWETMDIAVKPYPSCRYGHAAMDALIALRAEHGFSIDEIESVEIGQSKNGMRIIGEPEIEKQRPENYVDGQFSMPFVAAVALIEGRMDWDHYEKHLGRAETQALCQRIRTVVDPEVDAAFPPHMAGVARVRTARGTFERLVRIAKGEPENFLSADELRAKFDGLVGPYLTPERARALAEGLLALHQARDIGDLLALTVPEEAPALRAAAGD